MNLSYQHWQEYEDAEEKLDNLHTWKFVSATLMSFCCLLGFCGSAISSIIFLHRSMRLSPINFLLAAVSIIDLVAIILMVPMLIMPGMNFHFQSHGVYEIYMDCVLFVYPLVLMTQTASTWTYVLVVFERYIAVCQPLKSYKLLTMEQAKKTQWAIILVSVLYNLVRFLEYRRSEDEYVEEYFRANYYYFVFYYASLHLATHFLVPLSVIITLNIRIIRTLTRPRKRQLPLRRCSNSAAFTVRRQTRTAWMIVVATGAFVVTNTLTFFVNVWESFEPDLTTRPAIGGHILSDLGNILLISHSACSFFIYIAFCRQYRCLFRRMMVHAKFQISNILSGKSATNDEWVSLRVVTSHYGSSPTHDGDGRACFFRTRTRTLSTTVASSV